MIRLITSRSRSTGVRRKTPPHSKIFSSWTSKRSFAKNSRKPENVCMVISATLHTTKANSRPRRTRATRYINLVKAIMSRGIVIWGWNANISTMSWSLLAQPKERNTSLTSDFSTFLTKSTRFPIRKGSNSFLLSLFTTNPERRWRNITITRVISNAFLFFRPFVISTGP